MMKYKLQSGQTLVEVLVAMTVGVLVLTAITSSVLTSLVNSRVSTASSVANQYAQEAIEIARVSRTAPAGTFCLDKGVTRLVSTQSNCSSANIDGKFVRSVQILGSDSQNDCGIGVNKIIATVKWKDGKCANGTYCHQTSIASCANVIALAVTATVTPTPSQSPTPTLSPTPTPVAVQVDSTSNSGAETSNSTVSWPHTISGVDRLLVVGVVTENSATSGTVTWTVGSAQTLTQLYKTGTSGNQVAYLYYLVDPAVGTGTIQVNISGGNLKAGAISFTNVDPITPLGTKQSITASGTTVSTPTLASSTSEKIVSVVAVANNNTLTSTAVAPATKFWDVLGGTSNPSGAMSYQVGAASSVSSWSWSSSKTATIIAVPVKLVQ